MRDVVCLHIHASDHRILDLPVLQQSEALLRLTDTEGTGEALAVEAHRRRHHAFLRVLRIVHGHVLNLNAGARRGHDLVREETALIVGQARIDHRRRCGGLAVREKIKVLANLRLGRTRPVGDRQGDGCNNPEDNKGYNAHDHALDATAALIRHRRKGHARLRDCDSRSNHILGARSGRRRRGLGRGRGRGHRTLIRIVVLLRHLSILTVVRADGQALRCR